MVCDLAVLDPCVVDGPFAAAHAAGDLGALKGGPGGSGGGGHAPLVAQDHLAVGADIYHQRQLFPLVHVRGQDAAHGVRAYKAADQAQPVELRFGVDVQAHIRGLDGHGGLHIGIIGSQHQGLGGIFQEQVVHAGVAHDHQLDHVLRLPADLLRQLVEQPVDGGPHTARQHLGPLLHGGIGTLHHVAAVLALGVQRTLDAQLFAGEGVVQVQHDGGGAQVDGGQQRIFRLGQHAREQIHRPE